MFGSMQKTHECDVFYHLGRPVISQRPVIQWWMSGRGRWVKKHVNVKNEGIMQKTNHQMLMLNIISGNIQA
ncbi:MAG: hypothetical protein ACK5NJ_10780 [Citrobacter portucalensis]